jgi:outer membrane protein OmpA-like peptidoglycan-associated protein
MNSILKTSLFVIVAVVSLVTSGFTIEGTFGIKSGRATYYGDIKNQQLTTYSGASLDLWLHRKFGFQGLFYFGELKAEYNNEFFQTELDGISLLMKFRPLEKSVVSPYLMGGASYFRFNPSDKNGDQLPNNAAGVYSQQQFGFPVGLGISTFVSENFSIDLEGLYHFTLTDYLDDIERGGDKDAFASATIGISFHFGKLKDTDGDGIPDKRDADPLRPEDFDGYQDLDGAPDLDNDQDGVPDLKDKAPMQPEDIDGFEDEDGAPDLDNDGDGILDDEDKAPDEPEDFDNFEDSDGAPDPDNDQDTVPDAQDECPGTDQTLADSVDTKETLNGYEDKDGCPDTKPEIAVEKGESIVLEGVYFATGSANLTQNSRAILDQVFRTLRDNEKIEVEIQGHTDNTGGYQLNMRLSKQRADAVKLYLINRGIDAARIRTEGFGPDKPIAPNSTREGRAKNRRIEFYRIK